MELQIRHLRLLRVVADTGSLNRAAAALELPQPALSRQVRRLEELLGGALFERGPHGTRPTALGSTVLDHAECVLRILDDFGQRLHDHREVRSRALRVGWADSVLHEPLLNSLRRLPCGEHPRIVVTGSTRELVDLLRAGEIDIALRDHTLGQDGPLPSADGPVAQIAWGHSPVLLAVAANRPQATAERLTMADLAHEEWISVTGPDGCDGKLRALCASYGFTPRIAHDIPVSGPRCDVIRSRGCVALSQACRPLPPGVVHRSVDDLGLRVGHLVAFRRDSRIAAQVPALVAVLSAARPRPVTA
ncbi:LysR family transcriptional regulator [Streptomyces pini]|uniref:DNA-binding transcriptional regulator, LysR family n=1 Tax=Streptomyces pini TaxID=1520580 RepID=A0A1I3ZIY4_9ACTN|nr:LysR family transcriptional regulator [Streptomyces pini]SFK43529.1 DNA-binding transcriptional regulator, LysR family [Streptomyces pini]